LGDKTPKEGDMEKIALKKTLGNLGPPGVGGWWYAYMLRCSDNSLYAGATNDLWRRIEEHNAGTGSKYVRSRCPAKLAWYAGPMTKSQALREERWLKGLTKAQKEVLVRTQGYSEEERRVGRQIIEESLDKHRDRTAPKTSEGGTPKEGDQERALKDAERKGVIKGLKIASDIVDPPPPNDCGRTFQDIVFRQKLDSEIQDAIRAIAQEDEPPKEGDEKVIKAREFIKKCLEDQQVKEDLSRYEELKRLGKDDLGFRVD